MKLVVLDGYALNPGDLGWLRRVRLANLQLVECRFLGLDKANISILKTKMQNIGVLGLHIWQNG
jgi:hypothetical protein